MNSVFHHSRKGKKSNMLKTKTFSNLVSMSNKGGILGSVSYFMFMFSFFFSNLFKNQARKKDEQKCVVTYPSDDLQQIHTYLLDNPHYTSEKLWLTVLGDSSQWCLCISSKQLFFKITFWRMFVQQTVLQDTVSCTKVEGRFFSDQYNEDNIFLSLAILLADPLETLESAKLWIPQLLHKPTVYLSGIYLGLPPDHSHGIWRTRRNWSKHETTMTSVPLVMKFFVSVTS